MAAPVKKRTIWYNLPNPYSTKKNLSPGRKGTNQIHSAPTTPMGARWVVLSSNFILVRVRVGQMLLYTFNRMECNRHNSKSIQISILISICKIREVASTLTELWWDNNSKFKKGTHSTSLGHSSANRCKAAWSQQMVDGPASSHSRVRCNRAGSWVKIHRWCQLTKEKRWMITRSRWNWWMIKIYSPSSHFSNINNFRLPLGTKIHSLNDIHKWRWGSGTIRWFVQNCNYKILTKNHNRTNSINEEITKMQNIFIIFLFHNKLLFQRALVNIFTS